ncbi:oligosaccharide flippase family protein [Spirosoma horti]
MNTPNKLLQNTLIYSIGNLGSKFLAFFMVPLYSFFLNKSELGYYDVLLTFVSLLVPIVTLQISEACYRWLMDSENNHETKKLAISNSFIFLLVSEIFFVCIYVIIIQFKNVDYAIYFLFILLLSCLIPYLQQSARGLGDNYSFSLSGIINALTLLIFSVSFLYFFSLGLKGLLIATIISNFITAIFLICKIRLYKLVYLSKVSLSTLKDMLNYAWPLIPNAVSWWMINASNRFLILLFLNVEMNGIFAIANRFPSIILIVNTIFMLAFQDQVIAEVGNKKVNYDKIFDLFVRFEFSVIFIMISMSRYLLKLIVDPKFYDAWKYMPLLYISVAFSSFCAFLGTGYIREKKTKGIFYTTLIGGVVNLVISYILISKIGLYAPAVGTLAGFICVWIFRIYQTKVFFPIKINAVTLIALLLLTFVYCYLSFKGDGRVDLFLIVSAIIFFTYLNKELIGFLFKYIKTKYKIFGKKQIVF